MNCYEATYNIPNGVLRVNALRTIFEDDNSSRGNRLHDDWATYTKAFVKVLDGVAHRFVCNRHNIDHFFNQQFTLAVELSTEFKFCRIVHPSHFKKSSTSTVREESKQLLAAALAALAAPPQAGGAAVTALPDPPGQVPQGPS
jgi:hypothetical protein